MNYLELKCPNPKCRSEVFQIYLSCNKAVCEDCKTPYKLKDLMPDPPKVEHQRG